MLIQPACCNKVSKICVIEEIEGRRKSALMSLSIKEMQCHLYHHHLTQDTSHASWLQCRLSRFKIRNTALLWIPFFFGTYLCLLLLLSNPCMFLIHAINQSLFICFIKHAVLVAHYWHSSWITSTLEEYSQFEQNVCQMLFKFHHTA